MLGRVLCRAHWVPEWLQIRLVRFVCWMTSLGMKCRASALWLGPLHGWAVLSVLRLEVCGVCGGIVPGVLRSSPPQNLFESCNCLATC